MNKGPKHTLGMDEEGDQGASGDRTLHETSTKIEEPSMDDLKQTNENQKKELQQKDSEIKKLREEVAALKKLPASTHQQIEEKLNEDLMRLKNELTNKDSEIEKMREEIAAGKQTLEDLNRLLDSASIGGLSLDSGFLTDTRSVTSWTSTSTSASSLSLETQGAAGGQVKSKSRLSKLLKRLPRRRKSTDKATEAVRSAEDQTPCSQGGSMTKGRTSSFYTLQQLAAITDNIEQRDVTVRTAPLDEGKVFMMDIVRKFERSGPTLLVMETEEQLTEARNEKACSFMLTIDEWQQQLDSEETLEGITNMVTNCAQCPFLPDLKGRCWKFLSGNDAVADQVPEETATKGPRVLMRLLSSEDYTTFLSLQFGQMEMDANRGCHVTEHGYLVNTGPTQIRPDTIPFSRFHGTFTINPIRIPFTPTPQTPVQPIQHYFEIETELHIDGSRQFRFTTILEVGVVEEEELGKTEVSYGMPRSWCVRVGGCCSHNTKICIQIYNELECIKCFPLLVETGNQVTRHTLRFGFVVDVGIGRICIIDLDRGEVLLKVDAEFKDNLYPVFGIYSTPGDATVKIRLISGADIQIDENKEKLIHSCMT